MATTPMTVYTNTAIVREDLSNVLPVIAKAYTPFLSLINSKGKATAKKHEWVVDSVTVPTANNAQIDGIDVEPGAATYGERAYNYTQNLIQSWAIADSVGEDGTNIKIAVGDDYLSQKTKKTKQMAIDLEYALINSTGAVGVSAAAQSDCTAAEMCGLIAFGTANTAEIVSTSLTATGRATNTGEGQFKVLLGLIYANGAKPDFAYMSIANKNSISNWSGRNNTNDVDAAKATVQNFVQFYRTDEGYIEFLDNTTGMASTGKIFVGRQEGNMFVAWARKAVIKKLGKHGDNERFIMTQECTLHVDNNSSVGYLSLT